MDVQECRIRTRKAAAAVISTLWGKRAECAEELQRITSYINAIDESEVRQIMTLRYIKGSNGRPMAWADVAAHISPYATADSVRKIHDRFLGEN